MSCDQSIICLPRRNSLGRNSTFKELDANKAESGRGGKRVVAMACPYFREEYVGFCAAMNRLYVPSIAKMEQQCFKAYEQCAAFRGGACSAPAMPHSVSNDTEDEREPCLDVTFASHMATQHRTSGIATRHRLR